MAQRPGASWRRAGFPYVREVVAADATLRADIETARALGISLRRFLGWEPRTLTTHAGATVREPEYDAWERAIQVAYDGWRHSLCSDCGQPLQESLLDEKVPPDQRPRYRASFTQCRACEVLELSMAKQAEDDKGKKVGNLPAPTHHRHWRVDRI